MDRRTRAEGRLSRLPTTVRDVERVNRFAFRVKRFPAVQRVYGLLYPFLNTRTACILCRKKDPYGMRLRALRPVLRTVINPHDFDALRRDTIDGDIRR